MDLNDINPKEEEKRPIWSVIALVFGSLCLLLALIHFWAGPFAPPQTLEAGLTDVVNSMKQAAVNVATGAEPDRNAPARTWSIDDTIDVIVPLLGALAIILSVVGFSMKENGRLAGGAIAIGVSGIAFQFFAMYAMALLVILFIFLFLSHFGIDFG